MPIHWAEPEPPSATERLRARVRAEAAAYPSAVLWSNGLGFDLDAESGQWEFMSRDDGQWSARFIESGDMVPILAGFGPSALDAARGAMPTEWARECKAGDRAIQRARASMFPGGR
jgi:hypothetical protein